MSYFSDVYLKRINKDGNTSQERIQTRKEKEFDLLYLKKSGYQAKVYQVNEENCDVICSLQPNKWSETNLISNLLIPNREEGFKTGDLLKIFQKTKDKELNEIWLPLYKENNVAKGHQKYKVICLDERLNITDEYGNTTNCIPIKNVNLTAALIADIFSQSGDNYGYIEPNFKKQIITKDFDFLKKGLTFVIEGRRFKIVGVNNIDIKGVAFLTVSEILTTEPEPNSSKDLIVSEDENFFLNNR